MPSLQESLTENFYHWEKRARGWQVWPEAVELEPPFQPFFHSYSPVRIAVTDDGRKLTRVGSWIQKMKGRLTETSYEQSEQYPETNRTEPEPDNFYDDSPLIELQISLPPDQQIIKQTTEQFILSLSSLRKPASFEIIGTHSYIIIQIVCREPDSRLIRQQLQAYFPDAVISLSADFLRQRWTEDAESVVIDFGLSHEFMRPLRTFKNFEVDPLIGIMGALSNLEPGEVGVLQVLFQPARKQWAESITRSVTDWEGHSFFIDAPEMVGLAKEKIEYPLFAAVVRIGALSPDTERTKDIAISIGGVLAQFARPGSNELIPLDNDEYDDLLHEEDLLSRQSRRSGMLLNSSELVSLAHLPSVSVRSEKLKREIRKTRAAPSIALDHQLVLGENFHQGKTTTVTLGPEQRLRHTHVIGATGTGKSSLLLNLIIQDINNGEGLGVIDPHGDLIDQILGHIPEKRFDDVVLFDPADTDYPIGFNILSAHSEIEKNILSSDLGAVFRRLSTSWGDQMTSVLGNAILAFLESEKGGTLLDLRHFLIDPEFRNSFLKTVKDREVGYFWQKEFPLLSGRPQAPVLTRLDTFLRPKIIRNMVGQKENRINFQEVLNKKKIFLVKLAQGLIGEENAYLLGAFIVSKLHQVVMGRQELGERERQNFWLYIDEFQNFITPSMAAILSGARKYRLGLVLSHQDLEQLSKRDSEVASSVISNPATRICFRLGDFDAKKLRDGFSSFGAEDLQNLGVGEAICRIERAEYDFNLRTLPLPEVESGLAGHRRESLMVLSREKYARPRQEVEDEVFKEEPTAEPPPRTEEKADEQQSKEAKLEPAPKEELFAETRKDAKEETRAKPKSRAWPKEPPPPGRGGQQHKYLQNLIKRMGEDKGYKATVEKEILGGIGKVDVALEKDATSIACE
ncbi:MAG: type IV secretory system conjugative DNA transfer family protein, partial [Gammaproteobacteria bacterium]